jgi:uncharacterized membrane protein YqaE (UPF0057 family)
MLARVVSELNYDKGLGMINFKRRRSDYAVCLRMENHMAVTGADPIKIIFAILLPPVGVFLEVGLSKHFWLNILLTILGFVPGIIHALYVILKH